MSRIAWYQKYDDDDTRTGSPTKHSWKVEFDKIIRRMAEKQLGQTGVFHATFSRPALFKIRARHVMTPNTEKVFNNASIGIANGHFKNDFCDSNETCQDIVVTHDDAFYLKNILQVTKSIKQTTKH